MSRIAVPHVDAPRIDRLLRSIVGVSDLRFGWSGGALSAVHIHRAPHVQPHQIVRNVVSALQAAFNVQLEQQQVHVHETEASLASIPDTAPVARELVPAAADDAPPVATSTSKRTLSLAGSRGADGYGNVNGNGHGNGHANGNGHGRPAPAVNVNVNAPVLSRPVVLSGATIAPHAGRSTVQLQHIDFERLGAMARCRVQLSVDDRSYSAVAEAAASATAEAELAARVALDALRAAGWTSFTLLGVGFTTIAGTSYMVASVRHAGRAIPSAAAAPMFDSVAWSAAGAVLNAAGCGITEFAPRAVPVRRVETR